MYGCGHEALEPQDVRDPIAEEDENEMEADDQDRAVPEKQIDHEQVVDGI